MQSPIENRRKVAISTFIPLKQDLSLYCAGTGTSIKSGGGKLVLCAQIKPQSVERDEINTTDTHIYDCLLYCPVTGTSIKSGGIKPVL